MDALVEGLAAHGAWLASSGELERRQRARLEERVRDAVLQRLLALTWQESEGRDILEESLEALRTGEATPYEVADRIVRAVGG
jgi:LAO/AO transport system kinase